MAHTLETWPTLTISIDKIFDGQIWYLERGLDFGCTPDIMKSRLLFAAEQRDLDLNVFTTDIAVVVQSIARKRWKPKDEQIPEK